ncbi:hypothetical protein AB0J43_00525 [Nonomuraea fuscirosea]
MRGSVDLFVGESERYCQSCQNLVEVGQFSQAITGILSTTVREHLSEAQRSVGRG